MKRLDRSFPILWNRRRCSCKPKLEAGSGNMGVHQEQDVDGLGVDHPDKED